MDHSKWLDQFVDHNLGLAKQQQRGKIRKAIGSDPFAYLEEQGIKLVKPQLDAWAAIGRRKTIALPWGRGVGKTFFLRLIAYLFIAQFDGKKVLPESPNKGIRIVWLMDTLKHFKKVHSRGLIAELEGNGAWSFLGAKIDKTSWDVTFPGGSTMMPFPALEHTVQSARGQRCDIVLVDECDDVPISSFYSVAVPFFSEPWSYKLEVVGGTPRKGKYGLLYDLHSAGLSDDPKDRAYETFHANYADAPEIVDIETVEKARGRTPPAIFAREWECKFDNPEGLVYDNWVEDFHVKQLLTDECQWRDVVIGVDWGYVNPGCFLIGVVTGHSVSQDDEDRLRLWIVEEVYKSGEVIDWWADQAKQLHERFPNAKWHADPSDPGSAQTLRNKAKVNITKANNAVHPGVRQVATRLNVYGSLDEGGDTRYAMLHVSPKCKNLIREMSTYRRKPDPLDRDNYLEEIEPKNDHAADSLRYLIVGRFGIGDRRRRVVTSTSYG